MAETKELDELSPTELVAVARACLDRVAAGDSLAFDETRDDDDNLVRTYRWPESGRAFRLIARLDAREDCEADFGDISLLVEVDNRVGYIELVHEEDPDEAWLAEVVPQLCVSAHDDEARAWMHEAVTRIGSQLVDRALAFLRGFDEYKVTVASSEIRVEGLADMAFDEEDWREGPRALTEYMRALDGIAAVIESQLPEAHVACRYCGGRFDASGAQRCPHCGAAL